MNKNIDIEDLLRRYRSEPSARIKQSVLSRFADTFQKRPRGWRRISFWKRPIPLYATAAILIIAAGFSFLAGRNTAGRNPQPKPLHKASQERVTGSVSSISWHITQPDLLWKSRKPNSL